MSLEQFFYCISIAQRYRKDFLKGQKFRPSKKIQGRFTIDNNVYVPVWHNSRTVTGFSTPDLTTNRGKRSSTAEAYLRPVKNRPNIRLVAGAYVQKVTFF